MDEILEFFDFSKDFKREIAPRGCVSGSKGALASDIFDTKPMKREQIGTEYAIGCVEEEKRKMHELDMPHHSKHVQNSTLSSNIDVLSSEDDDDDMKIDFKTDEAFYRKYVFDLRRDDTLPIHDTKDEIIAAINANPVVILEGDTGCGKTTQVPQYILDDAYKRRQYCKIICTQPRRIAAISIARRVSDERKWEDGTVCAYQVGLHCNQSEDTRLLYVTTGVLLQKLIKEKSLESYTHIIIDEVHERDQDMDFLLIVIRRLLTLNSRHVKIILMSATFNTSEFSNYFTIRNKPAPIIRVDRRRLYQVREFYLNQLDRINATKIELEYEKPGIVKEMYSAVLKLVVVIDNIEKQEAAISMEDNSSTTGTSILIFLPGINEIDELLAKLNEICEADDYDIKLFPIRLHSMVAPEEQVKVFNYPPPGYRKVILATNIAESSITVPDVKYVIDFCLTKVLVTNCSTNFNSLQLQWASKANCRQRSGRAGRVMNGRVYRMVPKDFYDNELEEFGTPEMLRCPLERVVLKSKILDMGPPADILGLALSPPRLSDIRNTILTLKELGALYPQVDGVNSVNDGDLSFIGRVMADLPLDIRLSRLIVLGYAFSCLEDAIIIAAGLNQRSVFRFNDSRKSTEIESFIQKLLWADGSGSDLFAILRLYRTWSQMRINQNPTSAGEKAWASRYFVNLRALKEMDLLVQELKERLSRLSIKEITAYQRVQWIDREKAIILKIIICGAFYPNYFLRNNNNELDRERKIYQIISGNDPCNTVYFTGFDPRYFGHLYTRSIKDIFRDIRVLPRNINVTFQPGSEKIFVTFKSHPDDENDDDRHRRILVPGRVRPEVYKAVRMRNLNMRCKVSVLEPKKALRYAEEKGFGYIHEGEWKPIKKAIKNPELICLPSVFTKYMRGYITHINNCDEFYFQPLTEMVTLREIHTILNSPEELAECRFSSASEVAKGMMLSAPFQGKYHRAKVLSVIQSGRFHLQFKVLFIDYGNTALIDFENLRYYSKRVRDVCDISPRVFECRLAMVQPSSIVSMHDNWSDEAIDEMRSIDGVVEIEIYSLVGHVANVILKLRNSTFNEWLIEKNYARKSDENFMSKTDHDLRLRKQAITSRFREDDHAKQNEEYIRSLQPEEDFDMEPPPIEYCSRSIPLRGPFSPLETQVYNAVRVGSWKTVNIERESVNSILLDTDPQDLHDRLMVAASITVDNEQNKLTARGTTLMPNVHGYAALMTMLFCPTMQIKCDKNHTKYVAILAGLGYDPETYEPLYEEHDIVLSLDTNITSTDLSIINQLRYSMDSILKTDPGEDKPMVGVKERADFAATIKKLIIRLLNKNRKYIETHIDVNHNKWEPVDEKEVIRSVDIYGKRSLFPLHVAMRLYDENYDRMHALSLHCQELHSLRQFDGSMQQMTCRLCNQVLENISQLRIHLLSQLHRDREHQIRFKATANN